VGLPSVPLAESPDNEAKECWLSEFESAYAEDVMRKYGGNLSRAALAAGVDRKTFRKLLKKERRH
jgi:DNA-binding protein Fis